MSENRKRMNPRQHTPLRVPNGWSDEARRFVIQLEEILDDIYRRTGRIRFEDLDPALQKRIEDLEGDGT